jgi:hypothetical protein
MTYRKAPLIIVLLLAGVCSRAQSISIPDKEESRASAIGETFVPEPQSQVALPMLVSAQFFQRHTQLRRGRDMEIAVFLCQPTPRIPDCDSHYARRKNSIVPVSLQMEPAEGFTVRYGDGRHYKSAPQGTPDYLADKGLIFLKVHASGKLAPGQYRLKGTLAIRSLHGDDFSTPQHIPVEIPLTLVEHNTEVREMDWRYGSHPGEGFKNFMVGFVAVPYWTGAVLTAAAYCTVADCK